MTTEREATATFMFWCGRVNALEKATFAITLKRDGVTLDQHLHQIKVAKAAKQQAHRELQAVRGRHQPHKPVKLEQPETFDPQTLILDAEEFVQHLQRQVAGKHYTGPRQFIWAPKSKAEFDAICRGFDLPTVAKGAVRPKGFSLRRVA